MNLHTHSFCYAMNKEKDRTLHIRSVFLFFIRKIGGYKTQNGRSILGEGKTEGQLRKSRFYRECAFLYKAYFLFQELIWYNVTLFVYFVSFLFFRHIV